MPRLVAASMPSQWTSGLHTAYPTAFMNGTVYAL